jgi:hypothetical protein
MIPQWVRSLFTGNNNPDVDYFNVAASQTIVTGDFVQINATTGLLEAAVAASTTIIGIANADITTGGSVTAADNIPVVLAKNAVIRMNFTDAGTKKTFLQADLYTKAYDLSNKTTVNPDDTTGGMMQIVAFDNTKLTVDVVVLNANQYLK